MELREISTLNRVPSVSAVFTFGEDELLRAETGLIGVKRLCGVVHLLAFKDSYLASPRNRLTPTVGGHDMVVIGNFRNRAELRKKRRREFLYRARIHISPTLPLIKCLICDISETGARLALEKEETLPGNFTLLLTPDGYARRHCHVIWRDGLTLGVHFPDPR